MYNRHIIRSGFRHEERLRKGASVCAALWITRMKTISFYLYWLHRCDILKMHVLLAYRVAITAVPSAHAAPEIRASKRISNITQICSFLSYKLYAQGHSAMLRYTIRLSVCPYKVNVAHTRLPSVGFWS